MLPEDAYALIARFRHSGAVDIYLRTPNPQGRSYVTSIASHDDPSAKDKDGMVCWQQSWLFQKVGMVNLQMIVTKESRFKH